MTASRFNAFMGTKSSVLTTNWTSSGTLSDKKEILTPRDFDGARLSPVQSSCWAFPMGKRKGGNMNPALKFEC